MEPVFLQKRYCIPKILVLPAKEGNMLGLKEIRLWPKNLRTKLFLFWKVKSASLFKLILDGIFSMSKKLEDRKSMCATFYCFRKYPSNPSMLPKQKLKTSETRLYWGK